MTKKKFILFSVLGAIFICSILAGIIIHPYIVPRNFSESLNYEPSKITKIESYFYEWNGAVTKEITNPEEIREILSLFSDRQTLKSRTPFTPNYAFVPSLRFYEENKLVCFFEYSENTVLDKSTGSCYTMEDSLTNDQLCLLQNDKKDGELPDPVSFEDALCYNASEITKIVFFDGDLGDKTETVSPEVIKNLLSYFEDISAVQTFREQIEGLSCNFSFYAGETYICGFSCSGTTVRTDDKQFNINKNINKDTVYQILKQTD